MITVCEAAKLAGVGDETVRRWVRAGRLQSRRDGPRLLLFREIRDFVKRPERTEGRAVVISSHQLSDLERLADHVAILNKGKLIATGRMDELVERYVRIDARLATGGAIPAIQGVALLEQDGTRLRLMLDRKQIERAALVGMDVLGETPMSLEEIFVALVADAAQGQAA